MSYNVSYASSTNVTDLVTGATASELSAAGVTKYGDIFTESSDSFISGCKSCVVSCTCNTAKGWYTSASAAATAGGTTTSNVMSVTSQVPYAYTSTKTCYKAKPCDASQGYYSTDASCNSANSNGCYEDSGCYRGCPDTTWGSDECYNLLGSYDERYECETVLTEYPNCFAPKLKYFALNYHINTRSTLVNSYYQGFVYVTDLSTGYTYQKTFGEGDLDQELSVILPRSKAALDTTYLICVPMCYVREDLYSYPASFANPVLHYVESVKQGSTILKQIIINEGVVSSPSTSDGNYDYMYNYECGDNNTAPQRYNVPCLIFRPNEYSTDLGIPVFYIEI